jgi:hypothetical protein
MNLIQKLILLVYALAAFFIGFIKLPFVCHYEDGLSRYVGHHLRGTIANLLAQEGSIAYRFCTIDHSLVFVEVFTLTVIPAFSFLQGGYQDVSVSQ